jgi:hypothetical protein
LSQFLITVDDALRALAEGRTPEQLIGLANTAETLRRYAQRARLGMAAQNKCAELRLRAEGKLGQYLAGTPRNRAVVLNLFCCGTSFQPLTISASPGNSRTGRSGWRRSRPAISIVLHHSERRHATAKDRQSNRRGTHRRSGRLRARRLSAAMNTLQRQRFLGGGSRHGLPDWLSGVARAVEQCLRLGRQLGNQRRRSQ